MKENSLWRHLRREAKKDRDVVLWKRHQSPYQAGHPDVSFRVGPAAGQLELKTLKDWPARESTNVWVEVTPLQLQFLLEWRGPECQGLAFVLVLVGRRWLLLAPEDLQGRPTNAAGNPGLPRTQLEEIARAQGDLDDGLRQLWVALWAEFLATCRRSGAPFE